MSDNQTFVSYSRSDSQFAVKLASDLRANGASVWLDQLDIAAGARWDSAIEDALRSSARVIVLLSPKAVASQNVLDEVSFALDEGKTIVPVLVEACAIPMRLRRLQYVDFTPGYDVALGRLLTTLGGARTSVSRAAPPAPEPRTEPPAPPREPEPSASYEPSFALRETQVDRDGAQRKVWLGAAAFTAVVLIGAALVFWSGGSTAPTPSDPAVETPTATDAGGPAETSPAPTGTSATAPAPARNPPAEGTASKTVRMAEAGTSLEALDKFLGTRTAEGGLQALQRLTRELSTGDALTTAELERVADAQLKACPVEAPSSPCNTTARDAVSALLKAVCTRKVGPAPASASEFAALRYQTEVSGCEQTYSTTLIDRFNDSAKAAIRNIKPG